MQQIRQALYNLDRVSKPAGDSRFVLKLNLHPQFDSTGIDRTAKTLTSHDIAVKPSYNKNSVHRPGITKSEFQMMTIAMTRPAKIELMALAANTIPR